MENEFGDFEIEEMDEVAISAALADEGIEE
jgi:hypothetical protein